MNTTYVSDRMSLSEAILKKDKITRVISKFNYNNSKLIAEVEEDDHGMSSFKSNSHKPH
jgi:hypothetical protein